MTDRRGRHWTAADIKARTELVLEGRFARVLTAAEALAALDRKGNEAGSQAA
jgi:hypothetical protein